MRGITGDAFVPEALILPQDITALYDDPGLRAVMLATLSTLDNSGVAVRQTGGRDPHRRVWIPGAPAGGPQHGGMAPNASPAMGSSSLGKGKGLASSTSAPGSSRGSEEERRRRLRRADGSFVSKPAEKRQKTMDGDVQASSQAHGAHAPASSPTPPPPPPPGG